MELEFTSEPKIQYVVCHPINGYLQKGGTYTNDISMALRYTHLGRWSEYLTAGIDEHHVVLEVKIATTYKIEKQCDLTDAIDKFNERYEYMKTWDSTTEIKNTSQVWYSFLELRNKMISLGLIKEQDYPLSNENKHE